MFNSKVTRTITAISLGVLVGFTMFVVSEMNKEPEELDKVNPNVGGVDLEVMEEPLDNGNLVEPSETIESVTFDNEFDNMIYQATKDSEVDPYLAIAIARLETGHYTSDAFVNGYNFGGITLDSGIASFDSISDGLGRYVRLLQWYHRNGMTTAEQMQATYCPPNENWDEVINEIYESMISEVK